MNILIASDSFKDALDAPDVCRAISNGLKQANEQFICQEFPLADGGEGTAQILSLHRQAAWNTTTVCDPLFRETEAGYGFSKKENIAFIDMASASGLPLLSSEERNPLQTSTYGTGELILHAYQQGARRFILGIGGSATHDLGIGMAAALGYRFYDREGKPVRPMGGSLSQIYSIDDSALKIDISSIEVTVLCDVDNPLTGPKGAAEIYSRQKGATEAIVQQLENGSRHLGHFLEQYKQASIINLPGAGAAGGLGAGSIAFLNARIQPGIQTILHLIGFDEAIQKANLIITGEGSIDRQTVHGKLIYGICQRAEQYKVPAIALCGKLDASPDDIKAIGLRAAFSIQQMPVSLKEALTSTAANLERTAFNIGRLVKDEY